MIGVFKVAMAVVASRMAGDQLVLMVEAEPVGVCFQRQSLFEKSQAASRLSIKRVIATYTNVSLVLGNSS